MAPLLWKRFADALRRHLARQMALPSPGYADRSPSPSFAKIVEYQRRGVVHFHAVIRLDGPGGPTSPRASAVTGNDHRVRA